MSERRAIFLDFDGTYADRGTVPAGHVSTVRAARAAGHLVFLCTGRPKSMLSAHVLAAGFDGMVAAAGGYVEVGGQVVRDRRFPDELAARVVTVLDAHDVAYLLEAPEAVYGPPGVDDRLRARLAERFPDASARNEAEDILTDLRMSEDLAGTSFGKVTIVESRVPVTVLAEAIGDGIAVLPSSIEGMGDSAGEIYLADVHKATGMAIVVAHLALRREDVVAFGDGPNDLEMLRYAGVAVAIEGAHPDLVAAADHIARGPHEEGLVTAFTELGLT